MSTQGKGVRSRILPLALFALLCGLPVAFAQSAIPQSNQGLAGVNSTFKPTQRDLCPHCKKDDHKHVTAAEGGSTATYLLLSGICCMGAVLFNRRRQAVR